MHKKFTLPANKFVYLTALTVFGLILQASVTIAQTSWSGVYGNEWIDYTKRYVKIPVSVKGLYKIPFAISQMIFQRTSQIFNYGIEAKR